MPSRRLFPSGLSPATRTGDRTELWDLARLLNCGRWWGHLRWRAYQYGLPAVALNCFLYYYEKVAGFTYFSLRDYKPVVSSHFSALFLRFEQPSSKIKYSIMKIKGNDKTIFDCRSFYRNQSTNPLHHSFFPQTCSIHHPTSSFFRVHTISPHT